MRNQLGVLTILALLTATAMVPTAQASTVKWELTNADGPSGLVVRNLMDAAGSGSGAAGAIDVTNGVVWVSNAAATASIRINGLWSVNLQFTDVVRNLAGVASVQMFMGTWDPNGSFVSQGSQQILTIDADDKAIAQVLFDVTVPQGLYLAMFLDSNAGTASLSVGPSGGESPSMLSTPDQDPNYPVPELASILLVAVGLVVIAGVVYTKKRQQA